MSWEFEDGTKVSLAAGLVVKGGKVFTQGGLLALKISKGKTSKIYQPDFLSLKAPRMGLTKFSHEAVYQKPLIKKVRLNSRKGMRFNKNKYFEQSSYFRVEKTGKTYELWNRCLRVRGFLHRPQKFKPSALLMKGSFGRTDPSLHILKNAQAFVKNKEKKRVMIGQAKNFARLRVDRRDDAFLCSTYHFQKSKKGVEICFKDADVIKEQSVHLQKKGRVRFGKIKIRGAEIKVAKGPIRAKSSAYKYCFMKELMRNPDLEGDVIIQLKVTEKRAESASIIRSTIGNKAVEGCLLRVVKRLYFPKNKGEFVANIPLKFNSIEKLKFQSVGK